jgi:Ca2+-binding RTX toxin-like protein
MTVAIDDSDTIKGFDIFDSKSRWTLAADAQLTSEDDVVLLESRQYGRNKIDIDGAILAAAGQVAIRSSGFDNWIMAGTESTITGSVEILGAKTTFVNSGEASADESFMLLAGRGSHFYNAGTVSAAQYVVELHGRDTEFGNEAGDIVSLNGTAVFGDNSVEVYNRSGGSITALENAVELRTSKDEHSRFENDSTVIAGNLAFLGGAGKDRCLNYGSMTGDVRLGGGNDRFTIWREAQFDGIVYGGRGNDILYIRSEWGGERPDTPSFASQFVEMPGGGIDTVVTFFDWILGSSYENAKLDWHYDSDLTGNELNNILKGNDGRNRLSGEQGSDRLTGGENIDTFCFEDGFGRDGILDFEIGVDLIDLSGLSGIVDFEDLIANHVRGKRGAVVIFSGEDVLWIDTLKPGDLDPAQFIFADAV